MPYNQPGLLSSVAGGTRGLLSGLSPYSNRMMMAGLGLMSGNDWQQGFGNAMQGLGQGYVMDTDQGDRRDKKKEKAARDAAIRALVQSGQLGPNVTPEMGAAFSTMPGVAENAITQQFQPRPAGTSDMQEYQQAREQGFTGTLLDYQIKIREAGRPTTTVNTGEIKVPGGYQLKNPDDPAEGITPIKGGPAEQIPSELAARIGMAKNFLGQVPDIRAGLEKGSATGVWDNAQARLNSSSDQAVIYRKIESGTDALTRMLTGAGMPAAEASDYVRRYKPDLTDDATSAMNKLDQLEGELKSMMEEALRGRGGVPDDPANPGGNLYEKYGLEP